MMSSQIHITDSQRSLSIPLSLPTGCISLAAWRDESFSLSPFLQINGQVAVAETAKDSYLCTPECQWQNAADYETTLIARGVLPTACVPWELQLTTTYHTLSGCLAAWIRPEIHGPKGGMSLETITYGWQLRWSQAWQARGDGWTASPQGALISVPTQEGVTVVATAAALTLLADHNAPAALLIIEFPHEIDCRAPASIPAQLCLLYPGLHRNDTVGSVVISNGLPVAVSQKQVEALVKVGGSQGATLRRFIRHAPAVPGSGVQFPEPGRYHLCLEWAPSPESSSAALQLSFPFRYWPQAPEHQAQAEYAQLLLTSDIGSDYIVAYNFVNPTDVYLADDRDDILAEQAAIAHALWQQLGDPDLHALALQMVEQLLLHQQPDGGFTFGVSVNGFRGDYSDTNADVIQCLLRLARCEQTEVEQRQRWLHAAWRSAGFMLRFQDPAGFFWGRTDRPATYRYANQPWFTSYACVACLELLCDKQAHAALAESQPASARAIQTAPISHIPPPEALLEAAAKGLQWLVGTQATTGSFRFDTEGFYADYDDLSNTAVAVWALGRACQLLPEHPDAGLWWKAACRGVAYLLTLEKPALSGQFAGHGLPSVQKLVYDYKLGAAFATYLQLRCAGWQDGINRIATDVASANQRYLQHIRSIQGKGTITGGWASLYSLTEQAYLADYQWFERGSKWQQYVFLGWQGKMILLDLPR